MDKMNGLCQIEICENDLDQQEEEHSKQSYKGQLISKCRFGIFNSPKKRTKEI